jgi:predicted acylesterase/phospholipase RssA
MIYRRYLFVLALAALLNGCVFVARRSPPPNLINDATPVGFGPDIRLMSVDRERFVRRVPQWFTGLRHAAGEQPLNVLVLSGGGAGAAFGAGALLGLSDAHTRPRFQLVTGVSAGALLAPFAFLGSAWDGQLKHVFAGDGIEHLQRAVKWGAFEHVFFPRSARARDPLAHLVRDTYSDAMIDEIGRQYAAGRELIVATTDLDRQETVLWNMGAIAVYGGSAAHDLFRQVLVASASVPGAFPPVLIRVTEDGQTFDEMHVDGSVTTPLFFGPIIAPTVPGVRAELADANVYVIVNGALAMEPKESSVSTFSVLANSFSAQITYKTRDALTLILDTAHRNDMRLFMTEIPTGYSAGSYLDFSRAHLDKLFGYGESCAAQGLLWTTVEQSIQRNLRARSTEVSKDNLCPVNSAQRDR